MAKKQTYSWVLAAIFTNLLAAPLWAEESPNLLEIMQQLGRDLNQVSDGMWSEDFAGIATAAGAIANHPQPPVAQRTFIIKGLGSDAGRFRQGDQAIHDAALAIKGAAEQQDSEQVFQSYQDLVTGCMSCHTDFRARVRALSKTE